MDSDSVEQPAADPAPGEPPDADAGVPAPLQPPTVTVAEAASTHETAEPTAGGAPPHRALKLVVSLRPGNAMGYRALIALGSDALKAQGYSRKGSENVVGPMPAMGTIVKSGDDMWKIIAWIRSVNPSSASASAESAPPQ